MRYDRNNDKYDLAYDEAAGYFAAEQKEHHEREQAAMKGAGQ